MELDYRRAPGYACKRTGFLHTLARVAPSPTPPTPPVATSPGNPINLRALARWEQRLDWACILIFVLGPSPLPLYLGGYPTSSMFYLLIACAALSWLWLLWCMDRILILFADPLWLRCAFWLLSPCVPLELIFVGLRALRTGRVLKEAGVEVGYFQIRYPNPSFCPACQYDVRGIESGVCPECGVPLLLVPGETLLTQETMQSSPESVRDVPAGTPPETRSRQ